MADLPTKFHQTVGPKRRGRTSAISHHLAMVCLSQAGIIPALARPSAVNDVDDRKSKTIAFGNHFEHRIAYINNSLISSF